jgi:hypothetical protein
MVLTTGLSCASDEDMRHPFVDGAFYPKDPAQLSKMIDSFLAKVPSREAGEGEIAAILVPHAGYVYSGQVAAYAFKKIEGLPVDTVILFGPYHKTPFSGASVWTKGVWRTPLGDVPIDTELAEAIVRENPLFTFTKDAHRAEHSLETEVPFLQKTLKKFKIVPIVMNTPSVEVSQALAEAVLKHSKNKKILIVGSTDLSHYHAGDVAKQMDLEAIRIMESGDTAELLRQARGEKIEFCGLAATMTAIETAKRMGGDTIQTLRYAHSGNVTGDDSRVVGYSSLVIYKGPSQPPGTLSPADQRALLKLARDTLESHVTKKSVPVTEAPSEILNEPRAVFVTLRKGGDLRGCIGQLTAQGPLWDAVRDMTVASASTDPRFSPVEPSELNDILIEISVLTPPQKVQSAEEIALNRDGVILRQGRRSGVFLPKVAEETGWSKVEFLGELCSQKAGLPADCWEDPATELYTFQSFDFKE